MHSYTSGWKGASIIPDTPVPGALAWMLEASKLFDVVIYSSRSKDPEAITAMRMWLAYHAHASLPDLKASDLLASHHLRPREASGVPDHRRSCYML